MDIWVNGRRVSYREAAIAAGDRGFLFGDGVFETISVYSGTPLFLDEHVARMCRGARTLQFADYPNERQLRSTIFAALDSQQFLEGTVRVTLTRGVGGFNEPLAELTDYTLAIELRRSRTAATLDELASSLQRGIRATIVTTRRNPTSVLPSIKSLNFLDNVLAKETARRSGFDEALFCNLQGDVVEGASSNLFLVHRGAVYTPRPDGSFLAGITRSAVIRLCARLGIHCHEIAVKPEQLYAADEAFLTNSALPIRPLVQVDDFPIGNEQPGPVTTRLLEAYFEQVRSLTRQ